MRECPNCHHLNENNASQCERCGLPLQPQASEIRRAMRRAMRRALDERYQTPEVRQAVIALARGLGWALIVLGFVLFFLTPLPRIWDDLLMLGGGGGLLILAEAIKPRKLPGGTIEIIPPDDPDA